MNPSIHSSRFRVRRKLAALAAATSPRTRLLGQVGRAAPGLADRGTAFQRN